MTAYVIGQIHIRDASRWQEYVSHVGGTIAQYGGEVQFRGERAAVFSGEYPCLIPIRDAAADVTLVSYQA
jgi:uncharacterized protein (DUF1330 family)